MSAVNKFKYGDRVWACVTGVQRRRGTLMGYVDSYVAVRLDGDALDRRFDERELTPYDTSAEQRFVKHDRVLIGGTRKGQVVSINTHGDGTQTYGVRVNTTEIHHQVKAKDLIMTHPDAPEPPKPIPLFKRPVFAFSEGQRVVLKSTSEVGTVEKRTWSSSGASYSVSFAEGPGRTRCTQDIGEALLDKHWFKVNERVTDINGAEGYVYAHLGNTVDVRYVHSTTRKVLWDEASVTPWEDTTQAYPTETLRLLTDLNRSHDDAGKLRAEAEHLKTRLEELTQGRDDWQTLANDYQTRRDVLKVENDQLLKEVKRLKEQVASLKPVVISGYASRLDYSSDPRGGTEQSLNLTLRTGAGTIDISAKLIDSEQVRALYHLYNASAQEQTMLTVTIARK